MLIHTRRKDAWINSADARNRVTRDIEQNVAFEHLDIREFAGVRCSDASQPFSTKTIGMDVLASNQGKRASVEIHLATTPRRCATSDLGTHISKSHAAPS